jgi:hypothetical protein
MLARNAKFDWYQSTVLVQCPQDSGLVDLLLKAWPMSDWTPGKNLNGYTHGGYILRGERVLCHLCWGGQTGVNCKTTSDESPVLAQALRDFGRSHLPTRVDSCMDWYEEGLFDSLSAELIRYATDNRLGIDQQGDWVRGVGRTLYVGSKHSPVRICFYEKTAEQGTGAPSHWVRLEVRIRPNKQSRVSVASWDAETVFCAGWVPEALKALGWDDLEKRSIGTVWKVSDAHRARAALCRQYAAVMAGWADEVGGWDQLGGALERFVHELKAPGQTVGKADLVQVEGPQASTGSALVTTAKFAARIQGDLTVKA